MDTVPRITTAKHWIPLDEIYFNMQRSEDIKIPYIVVHTKKKSPWETQKKRQTFNLIYNQVLD